MLRTPCNIGPILEPQDSGGPWQPIGNKGVPTIVGRPTLAHLDGPDPNNHLRPLRYGLGY